MGNVWKDAYKSDDLNFLSPMGLLQAQLVGQFFKSTGLKFDRVITSPLLRARHTTMMILQEMDDWRRQIEVCVDIKEKGFTEPFESCQQRVKYSLDKNIVRNDESITLVVCHYYTMQAIIDGLGIDRNQMKLHCGKTIPNAMPFLYDTRNPKKLELVDFTKYGPQF